MLINYTYYCFLPLFGFVLIYCFVDLWGMEVWKSKDIGKEEQVPVISKRTELCYWAVLLYYDVYFGQVLKFFSYMT